MNSENSFKNTYQKLKEESDWKFSIQFYHYNDNGEPFQNTECEVEKVILDFVDEHGLIITLMTLESVFSFSEKNWAPHIGNDYVSFGSKKDDQTYCIIDFC